MRLRKRPNAPGCYRESSYDEHGLEKPLFLAHTVDFDPTLPEAAFPTVPLGTWAPGRQPEGTDDEIDHGNVEAAIRNNPPVESNDHQHVQEHDGFRLLPSIETEEIGDGNTQEVIQSNAYSKHLSNDQNAQQEGASQLPQFAEVPEDARPNPVALPFKWKAWNNIIGKFYDMKVQSASFMGGYSADELFIKTAQEYDGFKAREVLNPKGVRGVRYFIKCQDELLKLKWGALSEGLQLVIIHELTRDGSIEQAWKFLGLNQADRNHFDKLHDRESRIDQSEEGSCIDQFTKTSTRNILNGGFGTSDEFQDIWEETFEQVYKPTIFSFTSEDIENAEKFLSRYRCGECGYVKRAIERIKKYEGTNKCWRELKFHVQAEESDDELEDYPDIDDLDPFVFYKRKVPHEHLNGKASSQGQAATKPILATESDNKPDERLSKSKSRTTAPPSKLPESSGDMNASSAPVGTGDNAKASGTAQKGPRRPLIKLNVRCDKRHDHPMRAEIAGTRAYINHRAPCIVSRQEQYPPGFGSTVAAPVVLGQSTYIDRIRNDPGPVHNEQQLSKRRSLIVKLKANPKLSDLPQQRSEGIPIAAKPSLIVKLKVNPKILDLLQRRFGGMQTAAARDKPSLPATSIYPEGYDVSSGSSGCYALPTTSSQDLGNMHCGSDQQPTLVRGWPTTPSDQAYCPSSDIISDIHLSGLPAKARPTKRKLFQVTSTPPGLNPNLTDLEKSSNFVQGEPLPNPFRTNAPPKTPTGLGNVTQATTRLNCEPFNMLGATSDFTEMEQKIVDMIVSPGAAAGGTVAGTSNSPLGNTQPPQTLVPAHVYPEANPLDTSGVNGISHQKQTDLPYQPSPGGHGTDDKHNEQQQTIQQVNPQPSTLLTTLPDEHPPQNRRSSITDSEFDRLCELSDLLDMYLKSDNTDVVPPSQSAPMPDLSLPAKPENGRVAVLPGVPGLLHSTEIMSHIAPEVQIRAAQYSSTFRRSFDHPATAYLQCAPEVQSIPHLNSSAATEFTPQELDQNSPLPAKTPATPTPASRKASTVKEKVNAKASAKKPAPRNKLDRSTQSVADMASQDAPPASPPKSGKWLSYSESPAPTKAKPLARSSSKPQKAPAGTASTSSKATAQPPHVTTEMSTPSPGATTMGQFVPIQKAKPSIADTKAPMAGNGWVMEVANEAQVDPQQTLGAAPQILEHKTRLAARRSRDTSRKSSATPSEIQSLNDNGNNGGPASDMSGNAMVATTVKKKRKSGLENIPEDKDENQQKKQKMEDGGAVGTKLVGKLEHNDSDHRGVLKTSEAVADNVFEMNMCPQQQHDDQEMHD
ncbi:uncharacterized protein BP5553_06396 [Venustampulla echinocandica]|uniref:Uncharacterized protein n=1 Tax=Venustampulla echinocandica TaxID=2656787 RepID=A0A370TJU1_9HELO|nr:uncharacterized protein BP5553_06396 [Venustampulla echinocandica]RDL35784.1 hypothetical protein BP5553_06396 [Venustampulla echinocandica]